MTTPSKPKPATPLRYRAAVALDLSLVAASQRVGIRTDKARDTLAAYLDGALKLKATTIRAYINYLNMVAK